ncbi:MAG: hypothetical protein ACYCOU_01270 [Sulfobacillus sp.]
MITKHQNGFGYDFSQIAVGDTLWFVDHRRFEREPSGISKRHVVVQVGVRDIVFQLDAPEATPDTRRRFTRNGLREANIVITQEDTDKIRAHIALINRRSTLLNAVNSVQSVELDEPLMLAIEAWLERRKAAREARAAQKAAWATQSDA